MKPPAVVKLDPETIELLADKLAEKVLEYHVENEKLYTLKQLADIFNVHPRTLERKQIPFVRLNEGAKRLYNLQEVKKYLAIYS